MAATETCVKMLQLAHVCLPACVCVGAYFKGASHSGGVAERVNMCRCRCTVTTVILSWKSADVPLLRRDNEVVPRLSPPTDAQRRDSFEERAECSAPRDWNHRSLSCHRSVASAGATILFRYCHISNESHTTARPY